LVALIQKHTLIATSSMEVQFVSCFEATSHGYGEELYIWAYSCGFNDRPLKLYCDNSDAVYMAKNNISES